MISVCIFDTLENLGLNLFNDLVLEGRSKTFERFLNYSTAILVAREVHNYAFEIEEKRFSLVYRAELKHLLNNIVAKDVLHQFVRLIHPTLRAPILSELRE